MAKASPSNAGADCRTPKHHAAARQYDYLAVTAQGRRNCPFFHATRSTKQVLRTMTPLLPLEHFRRVLGYNPWHFFGLQGSTGASRITSECNDLVYQYTWQNANAAGRAEVLGAIESAENRLAAYLYYRPAPHYVVETVPWPRYQGGQQTRLSPVSALGRWISVSTGEKYVQTVGVETRALIQANQAVAYTDRDGDGLSELATITVATTITDPDQIEVYFNAVDRFDGSTPPTIGTPDEINTALCWRIQPVTVRIATGTATITGPAWIFVKPLQYEAGAPLDPATATNFAASVDIYRRYTDPDGITTDTSQAVLIWETTPCGGWWCCDGGGAFTTNAFDPAAVAYAIARAGIRDSANGIITPGPAVYNSTSAVFAETSFATGFEPDRVLLRYRAGIPLASGQMPPFWQTIVARFAMAELAERLAACDIANKELWRWQFDLARSSGNNDEAYGAVSTRDLENPFGTRRGHVFAWREVQQLMTGNGFLI